MSEEVEELRGKIIESEKKRVREKEKIRELKEKI
jgi:hypothetical protein